MTLFRMENASWPLERRLYWLRILQCLISVVNLLTTTFLLSYIRSKTTLIINGGLIVSCIVAGLTFLTTLLGHWCGRHFSGYYKRKCLVLFIAFDLWCIGLQVPAIALLAISGLPGDCHGLTAWNDYGELRYGYDVVGFGSNDIRGYLDQFCGMPKSYFWLSIILIVLYFYAIGLLIRQIVAMGRKAKTHRSYGEIIEPAGPSRPRSVNTTVASYGNYDDFAAMQMRAELCEDNVDSRGPPPYVSGGAGANSSMEKGDGSLSSVYSCCEMNGRNSSTYDTTEKGHVAEEDNATQGTVETQRLTPTNGRNAKGKPWL